MPATEREIISTLYLPPGLTDSPRFYKRWWHLIKLYITVPYSHFLYYTLAIAKSAEHPPQQQSKIYKIFIIKAK